MRVVAWLGMLLLCLALAGCSLFGRRPWRPNPVSDPAPGGPTPAQPVPAAASPKIGMLAGRIVDSFDQKPPKTYIQVTDTSAPPGAVPIDVVTDESGYFTIQGLEEKGRYKLVARAKDGDRLMAGQYFATASQGNIVIRISEDNVGPGTPDVPNWPGGKLPEKPEKPDNIKSPDAKWSNPPGGKSSPPVQLGIPTPQGQGGQSQGQGDASVPPRHESIVKPSPGSAPIILPGEIKNPFVPPKVPEPQPPTIKRSGALKPVIPSCTGNRFKLDDFALYDVDGKPWQFQEDAQGGLLLIDFWGTWCPPCMASLPEIVELHTKYAPQGLDVVGIAYEHDGTWDQQVSRIKAVRDSRDLLYPVLVGSGMTTCPVKKYFGVDSYPTLVLVDREGHILWRHEGRLDPLRRQQLELEIKRRLNLN